MNKKTIIEFLISTFIYCVLLGLLKYKVLTGMLMVFHSVRLIMKAMDKKEMEEINQMLKQLDIYGKEVKNLVLLFCTAIALLLLSATPFGMRKIIFKGEDNE